MKCSEKMDLEDLEKEIKRFVSEKYESIKNSSETFGEIERCYISYCGDLAWNGKPDLAVYISSEMEKKFNEDWRNAKIEHPSKKTNPRDIRGITVNLPQSDLPIHGIQPEAKENK